MKTRVLSALIFGAAVLASCGGLSTEEATGYCDRARKAESQCVDDAAYQQCISCYEDCGVDCTANESCPRQFTCD
jgi:hypothetical protein